MKSANFKMAVKLLMLVVIMSALTACGGATFVKGGMDPLKGNEKVGVVVPEFKLYKINPVFGPPVHLHDKLDELAVAKMKDAAIKELTQKGFTPVVLTANEKTAALLKKVNDLPKKDKTVADPATADLGDLHELFKEQGLDYLLVLDGDAVLPNSALHNIVAGVLDTAVGLVIGSVVDSGHFKGAFATRTGIVGADGKYSYYKELKYPKNFITAREDVVADILNNWIASRK